MAKTDNAASEQAFFFTAPEATSVQLVGDFTHWQRSPLSLTKQATGVWKTSVALAPGTYHYRFLVDGQWRDDPECTIKIPNVFGSYNMVREVAVSEVVAQVEAKKSKPVQRRTARKA
jgi:1,4-alpha-glucan branching enzyme